MEFARFQWFSFDCYGTLIDWESGILRALRPVLKKHQVRTTDEEILHWYAQKESALQQENYVSYRLILRKVVEGLGGELKFRPTARDLRCLEKSLPTWDPYPDTVSCLRALKRRFKLAILSNIDDDLFAGTAEQLRIRFDEVITAQQISSYKPALKNFHTLIERLGGTSERILHIAESNYHDTIPAQQLGLATVWVNRRADKRGSGATLPAQAGADLEVPDLQALVDAIGIQRGDG